MVRVGTSYSGRRASFFGLDPRQTFLRVIDLGLAVIRISAYWRDVAQGGYEELDWLMGEAERAGQPVLLTVGMKGIQWPEFYLPADVVPQVPKGGRVGGDRLLREGTLAFVSDTVTRYRSHGTLLAWQVENEPFNRSGPGRWWIDAELVRDEMAVVRALDQRPLVLNAFSHFDRLQDWWDRPHRFPLDPVGPVPEQTALDLLEAGDVLGLDVYTRIGVGLLHWEVVRRASRDWSAVAGRWLTRATAAGRQAWVIESQAEPWEPWRAGYRSPRSFQPGMTVQMFEQLSASGFRTILLWGAEYWLWRADNGDGDWLESVLAVLAAAG